VVPEALRLASREETNELPRWINSPGGAGSCNDLQQANSGARSKTLGGFWSKALSTSGRASSAEGCGRRHAQTLPESVVSTNPFGDTFSTIFRTPRSVAAFAPVSQRFSTAAWFRSKASWLRGCSAPLFSLKDMAAAHTSNVPRVGHDI
jgi:hypothetical protein